MQSSDSDYLKGYWEYIREGKDDSMRGIMVENCGLPEEHIYSSVDAMPDQASYYTIVVVKEDIHD